jgi:hypothetical protein
MSHRHVFFCCKKCPKNSFFNTRLILHNLVEVFFIVDRNLVEMLLVLLYPMCISPSDYN